MKVRPLSIQVCYIMLRVTIKGRARGGGGLGGVNPAESFVFVCQFESPYGPAFSRTVNPPPLKNFWIRFWLPDLPKFIGQYPHHFDILGPRIALAMQILLFLMTGRP